MPVGTVTTVHTVGHSNHPVDTFIGLLRQHGITTVVDVHSQPYSQWASQFSREPPQLSLF